jgi:CRP-like cAMP-binding protein
MTERERIEALRAAVELSALDHSRLQSLLPFFDEVAVPAGALLACGGCLGHEFFVVAEGEVEVCRRGRATRLGPGGSFGWAVMRERGRHDATVVATSPARLLVMSHAQFRAADALALAS